MVYFEGNTCCFTGHRPHKLPWGSNETDERCIQFKHRLFEAVSDAYTEGYRRFMCGMAIGCDTWFCETLLEMKPFCPELYIQAVLPCETQANRWTERDRSRYFSLLPRCDEVTTLQTAYTADCMTRRNIYMVDRSGLVMAAFDGSFGGTMQTVNYAVRQGKAVRYIPIV